MLCRSYNKKQRSNKMVFSRFKIGWKDRYHEASFRSLRDDLHEIQRRPLRSVVQWSWNARKVSVSDKIIIIFHLLTNSLHFCTRNSCKTKGKTVLVELVLTFSFAMCFMRAPILATPALWNFAGRVTETALTHSIDAAAA